MSTVFTTSSNNDARVALSLLFEDMLGAIGIDYRNELEDSDLFFSETVVEGSYDLGEWNWYGTPGLSGLVGIMDVFDPESPPPGGANYYFYGTEGSALGGAPAQRFAELRDEMNTTVEEDDLVPLIAEAEQILADELVIIPLYARLVVGATWDDMVGGFKHNPTEVGATWNMEYWYRKDL